MKIKILKKRIPPNAESEKPIFTIYILRDMLCPMTLKTRLDLNYVIWYLCKGRVDFFRILISLWGNEMPAKAPTWPVIRLTGGGQGKSSSSPQI